MRWVADFPKRIIHPLGVIFAVGVMLTFIFAPHVAFAASELRWGDLAGSFISMSNNQTYTVPLNEARPALVALDNFPTGEGVLFFIPDPTSPTREFVTNIADLFSGPTNLSWSQAGVYELDVYQAPPPVEVYLPLWQRWFSWILPHSAYAQNPEDFIETIRFTIVDADAPQYQECCSSVVFLPGFEASRLITGGNELWPPTLLDEVNDLNALRLDDSGNSITSNVLVDGILEKFHGASVYDGFKIFMDTFVPGTIKEWYPLAYDWRYAPERIINDGIETSGGHVDVLSLIEQIAARSDTGQVMLVAHSNGGLFGKAIIKALEDEGKSGIIDSFVMVGSPQLGTPQAIGGLLHGEGSELGTWYYTVVTKQQARNLGHNMESAYNLLPSREYFNHVTAPTVLFDANANYTTPWRADWGLAIGNYTELFQFLTDAFDTRAAPIDINHPEILDASILTNADTFHQTFDTYHIPDSIRTVQVAGWGVDTIKGLTYTAYAPYNYPYYVPEMTVEGDGTVVYPSALSSDGEEYYFDIKAYDKGKTEHKDLLSAQPTQTVIGSVITEEPITLTSYIKETKPVLENVEKRLLVSVHSPLTLGAYDSHGNFTGADPNNDPNLGIQFVKQDIPNSSYRQYGEGKYLTVPEGDTYSFKFNGTDSGTATIVVQSITTDTPTTTATYSNIPVTISASAELELDGTEEPQINLDSNGDGEVDQVIAPDGSELSLEEIIALLKEKINSLNVKDKLKKNLLKRVEQLEKKIEKKKHKNQKILEKLEKKIDKKVEKGKIDGADAEELATLLDELEAQSDEVSLDSETIQELKDKIEATSMPFTLKWLLLNRIDKLEKKTSLTNTLSRITKAVMRKGEKGKIADEDVQEIIDLLEQVESAL